MREAHVVEGLGDQPVNPLKEKTVGYPRRDLLKLGLGALPLAHLLARPGSILAAVPGSTFGGVQIGWRCDEELIDAKDETPTKAVLHFPGGLADFLSASTQGSAP